jgi:hypothetical protein
MAARAAGFALTWSTVTTPIRGTDLAGSGKGSASDVWAAERQPGAAAGRPCPSGSQARRSLLV